MAIKAVNRQNEKVVDMDPNIASVEDRDKVYSFLFTELDLNQEHKNELKRRGFTEKDWTAIGYQSSCDDKRKRFEILEKLKKEFGTELLRRVPGFFFNPKIEIVNSDEPCLYMPVRNPDKKIVAIRPRPNDSNKGKYKWLSTSEISTGQQVHCVFNFPEKKTLLITEGEIKAEYASLKLEMNALSIPGTPVGKKVMTQVLSYIKQLKPDRLCLAIDADLNVPSKKSVRSALDALYHELIGRGYTVEIYTWDEKLGNGIDDMLKVGGEPEVFDLKLPCPSMELWLKDLEQKEDFEQIQLFGYIKDELGALDEIVREKYLQRFHDIRVLPEKEGEEVRKPFPSLLALRKAVQPAVTHNNAKIRNEKTGQRHQDKADQITQDAIDNAEKALAQKKVKDSNGKIQMPVLITDLPESEDTGRRAPRHRPDVTIRSEILKNTLIYHDQIIFRDVLDQYLISVDPETGKQKPFDQPTFIAAARAANMAYSWKKVGRSFELVTDPKTLTEYATNIYNSSQLFSDADVLEMVVRHPVFTKNGPLCKPGYDKDSGYFVTKDCPQIDWDSLDISEQNRKKQKGILLGLVKGTFFADDEFSLPNWLGYLFTGMMKPYLGNVNIPLYYVGSTTQKAGKSFAVNIADYFYDGVRLKVRPLKKSRNNQNEELTKALLTMLLSNPERVKFDNITGKIDDDFLSALLTDGEVTDRALGFNKELTAIVNCMISMTGNSVKFSSDLSRRIFSSFIDIDPGDPKRSKRIETAEQLIKRIIEDRNKEYSEYWSAAFTFIKYWFVELKAEPGSVSLDSFDPWAPVISGILEGMGVQGFLADHKEITDELAIAMTRFLEVLYNTKLEKFEDNLSAPFRAGAENVFSTASYLDEDEDVADDDDEQNILAQYLGQGKQRSRMNKLGQLLNDNTPRTFGNYRLIFHVNKDGKKVVNSPYQIKFYPPGIVEQKTEVKENEITETEAQKELTFISQLDSENPVCTQIIRLLLPEPDGTPFSYIYGAIKYETYTDSEGKERNCVKNKDELEIILNELIVSGDLFQEGERYYVWNESNESK